MRVARAGVREYELQAELRARVPRATTPSRRTAASSAPARMPACCITARTTRRARAGDLVLIDAGAEYRNYASDITRTFPVDGRFSKEQRALHDLVGAAQRAALAKARPGVAVRRGARRRGRDADRRLAAPGPVEGHAWRRRSPTARIAGSIGTRPGTGSAWTCTTSANTASTANRACSSPAWCSPSSPACTSRPTTRASPAKWRGIGIRTEDDVRDHQRRPPRADRRAGPRRRRNRSLHGDVIVDLIPLPRGIDRAKRDRGG